MSFKVGEKIVYPNHGVTIVEQIGESSINGSRHTFLHLRLLANDSKLMVHVDNTQRIGLAVSDDLFHWDRVGDRPVIRPEEYGWAYCPTSGGAACRDAHVIEHAGRCERYYTAVTRAGHGWVGSSPRASRSPNSRRRATDSAGMSGRWAARVDLIRS